MDARKRPRTLDVDVAAGDTGDGDLERVRTVIQRGDNTQASDVEQNVEPDDPRQQQLRVMILEITSCT